MKRIGSFVVFFVSFLLANAKLIPIVYEDIEFCAKEGEDAKMFDYSHLEIFAESDTKVYLNGSWIVLKEIKSPWKVTFFAEKYIRSQWNMEMFNKKIPDFCKVIQSPLELWYHVTSKFNHKNCPFPAGTEIKFDKQSMTEVPMMYPNSMAGNWRLNFIGDFEGGKKECFRIKFDLVEA